MKEVRVGPSTRFSALNVHVPRHPKAQKIDKDTAGVPTLASSSMSLTRLTSSLDLTPFAVAPTSHLYIYTCHYAFFKAVCERCYSWLPRRHRVSYIYKPLFPSGSEIRNQKSEIGTTKNHLKTK